MPGVAAAAAVSGGRNFSVAPIRLVLPTSIVWFARFPRLSGLMIGMSVSSILVGVVSSLILALPVEVTPTDGEIQSGSFVGVTETGIRLDDQGTMRELPYDSLVSVQAKPLNRATPPMMKVKLSGGSELAVQSVALKDETLEIELRRQGTLKVPVRKVRSIRFRAGSPSTDAQWLGMLDSEGSGDVLAIRREGDRLDQVRGIIESIAENVVQFNVDGTAIQAPFDRLEGVVFGASQAVDGTQANLQIIDIYGSRWMVDSLRPSGPDDPLRIVLESNVEHAIPMSQLGTIRWNSSLLMLATQTPAEKTFKPVMGSTQLNPALEKWFSPMAASEDELIMHGDSMIEYRVEPGFERAVGSFRRDDRVDRTGKLRAIITMDDKVVWSQELHKSDASGFDLPLGENRRMQFRIESAGDSDLGDTVIVVRPRLLK